jgi:hypothetical protein
MSFFPTEPKKIRARIRRYERELRKEQDKFGYIGDGYGKRYLLGPLYLLMDDVEGAVRSCEWFEQTFPDDIGEPVHFLCWTHGLKGRTDGLRSPSEEVKLDFHNNSVIVFVILHAFRKKGQKTPSRHITTAERRLADLLEREEE